MVKMSRRIPPTPVAAPWYGSTADGWLWLSIRSAMATPSPPSMTPAFSPDPTSTCGASVGRRRRWIRLDLYEQCSLHMTEYIDSSSRLGSRPSTAIDLRELVVGEPEGAMEGRNDHKCTVVRGESAPVGLSYRSKCVQNSFYESAKEGRFRPYDSRAQGRLAEGRAHGRSVRNYLEALEAHKPKRGRKRTPESIRTRLAAIDSSLAGADPLGRVTLIQERMDLSAELNAMSAPAVDLGVAGERVRGGRRVTASARA